MQMSGQLHVPAALSPGKYLMVPTGWEVEWAPETVWTRWRGEKNPCLFRESKFGRRAQNLASVIFGCILVYP